MSCSDDRIAMLPILFAMLFSVIATTAIAARPRDGAPVGAVFAPGLPLSEIMQIVSDSGGQVIDTGRARNIVVALGRDPGFAAALYRQGAWFVFDGRAAAALCLTKGIAD